MKIAMMTNNYKPFTGGVPISIERLAKGLEALGHDVTIFAPTYRTDSDTDNGEEKIFRYKTFLNHFVGGIVLPNPFDKEIVAEFEKEKFDLIHVHHPMLIGRTAVYLAKRYDIPLVFTYHTRYEQYVKSYSGGRINLDSVMPYYLHTFMKNCSFVFAPTRGMKHYLSDVCKVSSGKIGILPTGVKKAYFQGNEKAINDIKQRYDAEGMPLLLTVSRMAGEKNVEFLLNSLVRVKDLYGDSFRVLMVGDGPDKEYLEEKSTELGLQKQVIFTGCVPNEEIAPYYQAADGFIFASKTETQGIVILEAFAGGTPVVALRASGVEDLVMDGDNGILTEENIEIYANKLAAFLKAAAWKNNQYNTLVQGALKSAWLYSEEAVALKAEHYYNVVVAEYEMQKKRSGQRWTRNIVY